MMAIRGRKPTPVADKIALGNPGHRPLDTLLPEPENGPLTIPEEVLADPVALTHWRAYVRAFGHLRPGDEDMLGDLCLCRAELRRARIDMKKVPLVVLAPKSGHPMQNPFFSIVRQLVDQTRKLKADLGLTVAERSRINLNGAQADDPAERFFNA